MIAKEWGPQFGTRANTYDSKGLSHRNRTLSLTPFHLRVSFGAVNTRLTQGKELNASITMADGTKVALGIPGASTKSATGDRYVDVPLRRAASATEAALTVLAVVSPLMSYVTGQTIEVTGGRWI